MPRLGRYPAILPIGSPELDRSGKRQTHRLRCWSPRLRSLAREPSVAPPQRFLFELGTCKRTLQRRCPLVPRWFPLAPSCVTADCMVSAKEQRASNQVDTRIVLICGRTDTTLHAEWLTLCAQFDGGRWSACRNAGSLPRSRRAPTRPAARDRSCPARAPPAWRALRYRGHRWLEAVVSEGDAQEAPALRRVLG